MEEIGKKREGMRGISKSRKGFRYGVWQVPGPGNTSIKELLAEDRYVDAVLHFLKAMKVGEVKAGVIAGHEVHVRVGGWG